MEEPDFSTLRVAILGLGLMGGSLALGLRGRVREVRAADPDAKSAGAGGADGDCRCA